MRLRIRPSGLRACDGGAHRGRSRRDRRAELLRGRNLRRVRGHDFRECGVLQKRIRPSGLRACDGGAHRGRSRRDRRAELLRGRNLRRVRGHDAHESCVPW